MSLWRTPPLWLTWYLLLCQSCSPLTGTLPFLRGSLLLPAAHARRTTEAHPTMTSPFLTSLRIKGLCFSHTVGVLLCLRVLAIIIVLGEMSKHRL